MEARTKRIFKFLFFTLFVDLLAFTLILPLLPKILDYYATNDKSGAYKLFDNNVKVLQNLLSVPESHNQVLLAGILGSWFSLLQFMSSPFLGALSDRFGRKPILLLAMSGSVISYAVWFIAVDSFGLFVLSRTIGGLCKANVGLSLAIVSDVSDESSRGKGMAIVGSSFSLAFIVGPLLGAYLTSLAKRDQLYNQLIACPSSIATLLSLINLAMVAIFLEETKPKQIRKSLNQKSIKATGGNSITQAFDYINPRLLFSFNIVKWETREEAIVLQKVGRIYFYYLLLYSGLEFTLSFLTHIRFGFTSMDQGKLYLFSGLLMAIIQGGYIRRMKSGKEILLSFIGIALIIPSFILMGLSTSVNQIYYSLSLYSFSSAVVVPCLTTIVSSQSPVESRGAVMGTFRSIGSLSRALGPGLASLMFWTFGPTLCYTVGALALLLPLYLMRDLSKNFRNKNNLNSNPKKKSVAFRETFAKAS